MSCHTILKYLYEPKMDVILTISFKITAEIEKSYFVDEDVYRLLMKHNYVLSFIHCHGKYVYIVFFSLLLIAWLDHLSTAWFGQVISLTISCPLHLFL